MASAPPAAAAWVAALGAKNSDNGGASRGGTASTDHWMSVPSSIATNVPEMVLENVIIDSPLRNFGVRKFAQVESAHGCETQGALTEIPVRDWMQEAMRRGGGLFFPVKEFANDLFDSLQRPHIAAADRPESMRPISPNLPIHLIHEVIDSTSIPRESGI